MALTLSGTNGVVGAGFTVDASGVSVTAGVGTFGSLAAPAAGLTGALPAISGANLTALPAANLTGALPAISAASLTNVPASNIVGIATTGLAETGGFGSLRKLSTTTISTTVNTVSFTNAISGAFDGTFDRLLVVIDRIRCAGDGEDIHMRQMTGSTPAQYTSSEYGATTIGAQNSEQFGGNTFWRLNYNSVGNNSSGSALYEDYSAYIYLHGLEANRRMRYHGTCTYGDGSSNKKVFTIGGGVNDHSLVTGILFFWQSSTFAGSGGKISLYGVA